MSNNDWSRRAQLQRIVGARGTVQPFARSASLERRAVGWYVAPQVTAAGCECGFCRAAREDREVFLASSVFVAAQVLARWADSHPALGSEPPRKPHLTS
jgi:hypothetical protein